MQGAIAWNLQALDERNLLRGAFHAAEALPRLHLLANRLQELGGQHVQVVSLVQCQHESVDIREILPAEHGIKQAWARVCSRA